MRGARRWRAGGLGAALVLQAAAGCAAPDYDPEAAARPHPATPDTAGSIRNARSGTVHRSLLEAVRTAAPGDTLEVSAGTHRGNEPVDIDRPVEIVGAGWTQTRIELLYDAVLRFRGVRRGGVRGVSLVRVHRQPPFTTDALRLEDCAVTVADAFIAGAGVDVEFLHWAAIHLGGDCRGTRIERCVLTGNDVAIYVESGGRCDAIVANTIVGNRRAILDRREYDEEATVGVEEFAENVLAGNTTLGGWYDQRTDLRRTNGAYGNGGAPPTGGVLDAPPWFADPGALDWRLHPESPLAKAGRSGGPIGAVGTWSAADGEPLPDDARRSR